MRSRSAQMLPTVGRRWASGFADVKRVAVVGGGVAGLQAARALAARGITPVVFEASEDVGGVWRSQYSSYGIQVPKKLYQIPDFPAPYGDYAAGEEVQAYVKSFASAFGVDKAVRTNTRVTGLAPRADGAPGWDVTALNTASASSGTEAFDFAVLATGMYHTPFLPSYPGQGDGTFRGTVLHSSAFTGAAAPAACAGKHVVVVGGGKSAVDCALEAKRLGAASSTLLFRAAHWGTPRKIAGALSFEYVFLSRLGQALVSWLKGALPNAAPPSVAAAHRALGPVMPAIFSIVEALFAFQLGHRGQRRPADDVVRDFYGFAQVLSPEFDAAVKAGAVKAVRGEIAALGPDAAQLRSDSGAASGSSSIPCDTLVLATGYQKDYSALLPPATLDALASPPAPDMAPGASDGLYLYRHTLPAAARSLRLGFVGSELAAINNACAYGLQAEWLARVLAGEVALPPEADMSAAIATHRDWARSWMPPTGSRAALVLLHQTHFFDALLKDMGLPHRRKGANVLAELFMPYTTADYAGVCAGKPLTQAAA